MKTIKLHNCTAKEFRIDGTYTEEKERHEKHFDFTLTYQKTDGLDDDTRITWVEDEPADKDEIEKTIFRQFDFEKKALLKMSELTETENENVKLREALEKVFVSFPSHGVRPDSNLYKTVYAAIQKATT